jgi:hypothetical protein
LPPHRSPSRARSRARGGAQSRRPSDRRSSEITPTHAGVTTQRPPRTLAERLPRAPAFAATGSPARRAAEPPLAALALLRQKQSCGPLGRRYRNGRAAVVPAGADLTPASSGGCEREAGVGLHARGSSRQVCRFDHRRIRIHLEAIAMRVPGSELAIARAHPVRDAMSFTMCAASLPTPGRNPDDIA